MNHPHFDPDRLLPSGDQQPTRREYVLGWLLHVQKALLSINGVGLLVACAVFVFFAIWLSARLVNYFMKHLDGVLQ